MLPPLRASRLLDQVRERARYLHFSLRTEQAYVYWIRAFVRYHGCRAHPSEMGAAEVEAFLTWLAAERGVAASTHGQALSALLFLYQRVLGLDLPWMQSIGRPRRQPRLPVVLSQDQVLRILERFDNAGDAHGLLARLLYGTGMRIAEGLRLRVKDVDFERRTLIVQCGKGGKDRALMLPAAVVAPLPEDEPPGLRARSYGLRHSPPTVEEFNTVSAGRQPANWDKFALPRITAPAARRRRVTSASLAGTLNSSA